MNLQVHYVEEKIRIPHFHDHLHYYYHCQGHVHTVTILAKVVKVKPVGGGAFHRQQWPSTLVSA